MSYGRLRLPVVDDPRPRAQRQDGPAVQLRDLFVPLHRLLLADGDGRLALTAGGANAYYCRPTPCPDALEFSSSTASSISRRGYEAAGRARGALMQAAIQHGLDAAYETRIDQMRDELKALLGLGASATEVVFSASGTDAQLQALALTRALLGERLTSIVVGADQTGSGTVHTARGRHFGDVTSNGQTVAKGTPLAGLPSIKSIALSLRDTAGERLSESEVDAQVLAAVTRAVASGDRVLLQLMDCSKLGWRAPSDLLIAEIATRWPTQVQLVVDACQMRLSRRRIAWYLDRGAMVLLTGSKFFTGPAFSGALLLPPPLAQTLSARDADLSGLHAYNVRSDWPAGWALRGQFAPRLKVGQWLRWEAALEEIRAYYAVPDQFRRTALHELGVGIARMIAASPSLRLLPPQQHPGDDEMALPTIFAFTLEPDGVPLASQACKGIHRALARAEADSHSGGVDDLVTEASCLVGQPVEWQGAAGQSIAALRICIGARHVSDAWSADASLAKRNLQRQLAHVATIVARTEWLLRQHHETTIFPRDPMATQPETTSAAADRIGFARLTKMAFDGVSLLPLWQELIGKVTNGTASAGEGLDLSLIAQLLGQKETGLAVQDEVLALHQLFRSPCSAEQPRLRVLALAAAIDMGGNTPIEFLLENSGIELTTLYVVPGAGIPDQLPEHDVAIVIASDSEECRYALAEIAKRAPSWPRPLLNPPDRIGNLDRDKLHRLLRGIDGIEIPATASVSRAQLVEVLLMSQTLADVAAGADFPVIIRPRGSHAGVGLAKLDDTVALANYLIERREQEFFVSPFVDYSSEDGLFRKYRIVIADGKAYACHMAIADQWNIWYLNAGMSESAEKRLEEATFMYTFDFGFALRHRSALATMSERVGLDYFMVDCAQTKAGDLLIFEADNTAVVHNMDSPELYPYKPPQMHKIFDAFAAMLARRVAQHADRAA